MRENEFELITLIALRKASYYAAVKKKLLESTASTTDKRETLPRLRRAIADLDNMLFVGPDERASGKLEPAAELAQLNLDVREITRAVMSKMGAAQPD